MTGNVAGYSSLLTQSSEPETEVTKLKTELV
jgi:hypothetical protein